MLIIGMTSCKNEEKELAEKRISELENYVDSLKAVTADDLEQNWESISVEFEKRKEIANETFNNLKEDVKTESLEKADAVNAKYEELKNSVLANIQQRKAMQNPNQILRDRFFGSEKIGEDMNFSWVNKDNILKTYQDFLQVYKDNKSNFSREDYDEVKLMYEALDSRKNTVENEGLSTEDNRKIAAIKLEFAPMFKINRIGAKSRENAEAKE